MLQMSVWHPDALEFIVAKMPRSLGFLDDWRANAWARLEWSNPSNKRDVHVQFMIERFYSHWVQFKEWPSFHEVATDMEANGFDGHGALEIAMRFEIVKVANGSVTPMITDWSTSEWREANRDWDLPLQNCNMSVRVPDELMHAVESDSPWVFSWFDSDPPKDDEHGWTKTDALSDNGELLEYEDGTYFGVEDHSEVHAAFGEPADGGHLYRYGVVLTTWEGLRANLAPNQNMWRDTDYARFYRTVILPTTAKYTGTIMARQVWELITTMAHSHADPGMVFESTYERFQPVSTTLYGERLSNPCSEYVNSPGGSCDLASVNLREAARRADLPKPTHRFSGQHYGELLCTESFTRFEKEVTEIARKTLIYIAHALNYNVAPVGYIHDLTLNHFRTVGVGMMGLAEAMMLFGIEYGSAASERFSAHVMALINLACWEESFELGATGWKKPEAWNPGRMAKIFGHRQVHCVEYGLPKSISVRYRALQRMTLHGQYATHTCTTSVAPTGTISMIASWTMMQNESTEFQVNDRVVTSGCEPPFAWSVMRQDSSGSCTILHDLWHHGGMLGKPWMKTSSDIPPEGHIRVQGAVAAFTCMSVSKTVNMSSDATIDDVSKAYWLAWKLGIPGSAIYRNDSKPMQVLSALDCPGGECAIDFGDEDAPDEDDHVGGAQLSLLS